MERGDAARDLRENTRAQVHQLPAELFAPSELAALAPDVVLLNPPRTGCAEIVIDALRDAAPRRIVYVSCDPATLARDLARLNPSSGGYRVSRVVGIDALPQTHHVEAIVVLGVDAP